MYEKFYGLTCSPFDLSPNPRFYLPTSTHNEALATLSYGIMRRKGFIVLTGEVGTGKTLLLRYLLQFLSHNRVEFAFLYNPRLSVQEFFAYLLRDLRLPSTGQTKGEMLAQLNEYLLLRSGRGTATAVIIDEAHLLSWELMEEVRLLTNLETTQHKLLQILLVGQSELDRKLDSEDLRQLKQRITLRSTLKPLTLSEVRTYIHRRLQTAGANSHAKTIFPEETICLIYDLSQGIPRIVNNLCENALVSGYGQQARQVSVDLIREVAADLRLSPNTTERVSLQQVMRVGV